MNLIKIIIIVIFVIGVGIVYSLVDWQKSTDMNLIDGISNFAEINFSNFLLTNEENRPNIVVIMTDDLDVTTLKEMLDKGWMPNLKKLIIDRGTEFTNSFVTASKCCPSRSTFLTGQYLHNHGVLRNSEILNLNDNHTLATWLHNAGYKTAHVGKYLNWYGTALNASYVPPGWDSWKTLIDPFTYRVYNYKISDNGLILEFGNSTLDYQTDVLAKLSAEFIETSDLIDDPSPFFLVVMPLPPHEEQQVTKQCFIHGLPLGIIRAPSRYLGTASEVPLPISPSFNETDVSDKPIWIKEFPLIDAEDLKCIEMIYQNRIESMRAVDDLIKLVIESLQKNNEYENTVIIFTSDNGFLFGEHREWSKLNAYEESIRVPLYISTPNNRDVQSSSHLVINNDLAPTILDFADTKSDISVDGRSLVPLLINPTTENWRDKFLVEHWEGKYHLTQYLPTYKAIRTNSEIYIEYENSTGEYYDLTKDPFQLNNQIECTDDICKKRISGLKESLTELKNCGNGTCQLIENELQN